MIKKPLVSILVCTFNAENFFDLTIDSIINQTYKNIEILILDNNSKDSTRKIIGKYQKKDKRIKSFFLKKNLGAYGGLNFLLNQTKGKYIAIADHDDIYHQKKIEKQVIFLEKNRHYLACGSNLYKYFEKNKTFKYLKIKRIGTFATHPSLMFRYYENFKYNLNIKYKTDTFFMKYILCKKQPKIFNIQKALYLSRLRSDNKNLATILNKKLSFKDILNYYNYSKDKKDLIKFTLKKILNYNLIKNIIDQFNRKTINDFKKDKFLKEYLKYL
jgi:teichuronic acid biosynthesis glycosyltransferase TuaG